MRQLGEEKRKERATTFLPPSPEDEWFWGRAAADSPDWDRSLVGPTAVCDAEQSGVGVRESWGK